jgi:hypothetical protein
VRQRKEPYTAVERVAAAAEQDTLMPDDTKDHFFACNLLWWSLRVSFGRPELLQADGLAARLEAYDGRLDELVRGSWTSSCT